MTFGIHALNVTDVITLLIYVRGRTGGARSNQSTGCQTRAGTDCGATAATDCGACDGT
jgi:hypothetical protein